jgi:hypothetical protein
VADVVALLALLGVAIAMALTTTPSRREIRRARGLAPNPAASAPAGPTGATGETAATAPAEPLPLEEAAAALEDDLNDAQGAGEISSDAAADIATRAQEALDAYALEGDLEKALGKIAEAHAKLDEAEEKGEVAPERAAAIRADLEALAVAMQAVPPSPGENGDDGGGDGGDGGPGSSGESPGKGKGKDKGKGKGNGKEGGDDD